MRLITIAIIIYSILTLSCKVQTYKEPVKPSNNWDKQLYEEDYESKYLIKSPLRRTVSYYITNIDMNNTDTIYITGKVFETFDTGNGMGGPTLEDAVVGTIKSLKIPKNHYDLDIEYDIATPAEFRIHRFYKRDGSLSTKERYGIFLK